jgi:uncharacterized Fe-S center protein
MKKFLISTIAALTMVSCGNLTKVDETVSDVFFTEFITIEGFDKIFEYIADKLGTGNIAFKTHFGEPGNPYFVKPYLFENIVNRLNATFVETNVLYGGPRGTTASHIQVGLDHGFTFAPIDIFDVEKTIKNVDGVKHYAEFYVGKGLDDYDATLVLSRFKGHGGTGFGGAIKNVSMGFATPRGKKAMHANNIPVVEMSKCTHCGICKEICPEGAIISLYPLTIDRDKCTGCGKCIDYCPEQALEVPHRDETHRIFNERLVEYAKAVQDNHKMVYINVLIDITRGCDCMSNPGQPIMPNIGILASTDMVAIEKASHDLVSKVTGCDEPFFRLAQNSGSGLHQLVYAHQLGMGNLNYRLINIDTEKKKIVKTNHKK